MTLDARLVVRRAGFTLDIELDVAAGEVRVRGRVWCLRQDVRHIHEVIVVRVPGDDRAEVRE